jgi:hypothetical protein
MAETTRPDEREDGELSDEDLDRVAGGTLQVVLEKKESAIQVLDNIAGRLATTADSVIHNLK